MEIPVMVIIIEGVQVKEVRWVTQEEAFGYLTQYLSKEEGKNAQVDDANGTGADRRGSCILHTVRRS